MNTERTADIASLSSSASSSSFLLAPTVGVVKKEEDEEELPLVVSSSSATSAASSSIPSTRIYPMTKEERGEGGDTTDTIGTDIGGNCHRDGARRGVKKEEDDTVPSLLSSSSTVPDSICRSCSSNNSSNCSDGMDGGNTYWRTGDWCWVKEDEAHTHDEEEEADAENSIEANTGPATVVPASRVAVKKEEHEVRTPRPPLQMVARSKATDPTRPDHITLRPRRTKTRKQKMKQEEEQHDVTVAAVVTGTNRKRKSDHQSRDNSPKKKPTMSSIQDNDNSNITNIDIDDTNDGIHGDDDDDDNYNDNDDDPESENDDDGSEWNDDNSDNNSVMVATDTTTTNGEEIVHNKREEKWNEMFARLMKYKTKYQSTSVPMTYEDDMPLGRWVHQQRTLYTNNKLSQDRINQLNSIDFVWDLYEARWMEMYERLVAYKDQYGSTCVPTKYRANPRLGVWVDNLRNNYNNTSYRKLSVVRRNLLNSIGFDWNLRDAKWTKMYARLVAYKDQYGSTCVPKSYKADRKLHRWVSTQRTSYNTNSPHLTAAKKQQLSSIGFVWKVKK